MTKINNMYAVISGDIISSTSLGKKDKEALETALQHLLSELKSRFGLFARIIKGDYLECVLTDPSQALLVTLAIKSYVKNIPIALDSKGIQKNRAQLFKEHGIRIAIGYGTLSRYDPEKGIVDGEAIYLSGRLINSQSTRGTERIVIKNTLFFVSEDEKLNEKWEAILGLLDVMFSNATARQCEVVYLKLTGLDEKTIARKLGIDQSVVNRHSNSIGWNAIDKATQYFSKTIPSS